MIDFEKDYVLAVKHPATALLKLLSGDAPTVKQVHVSHPISEPRRMVTDGDASGVDQINE